MSSLILMTDFSLFNSYDLRSTVFAKIIEKIINIHKKKRNNKII